MADLIDADDGSNEYMAYRDRAGSESLIDAARARRDQRAKPTQVQPTTPKPSQTDPAVIVAPPAAGAVDKVIGVVKDIGRGVLEAPKQAIGGVSDAVHELFTAGDHLADWLNENVIDLEIGERQDPATLNPIGQLLQNPAEAIAGSGDEVGEAKSVTGGLARDAVQFITGMAGPTKALKAAGVPTAPAMMAGGAYSDVMAQSPEEDTLAEFVQKYPQFENPVTEFLSSDTNDPEVVKRLKNAVEGFLGGELTDGFVRGLKFIASKRKAAPQIGAQPMPNQIEQPQLKSQDLALLGDSSAPLVEIKDPPAADRAVAGKIERGLTETETGVPDEVAATALTKSGEPGGKEVYVNFARINSPDDVKSVIGQMADAFSGHIDETRRGVRTNEATQEAADALGMSVADVLRRRKGQGFNAEEALAARQLLTSSGEKLLEAAKKAAAPGASPADQYVFRKMMATHYAIQAEVIGARTETARALQSWSIPAGGSAEQMKALEAMIANSGGSDVSAQMAKRLALLAESGADAATINQAVRKGWSATTMDAVKEFWINGLLSSPTTHIVNTVSNFQVALQQIAERGIAGKVSRMTGSGGVAEGEATAMMFGLVQGTKDAFITAARTAHTGEAPTMLGKMDAVREPAISARAFNLDEGGGVGRTVDLLGSALRIPGRALETQDAFFKSIGYRMELWAQSYRQASSEGLEGKALGERVAQLVNDPPENIRIAAADAALYNTFTNETGEIGKSVMKLRGSWAPITFVLPFVRTPVNIARYSFERTPLAPLVGQWRADIAAGGARRDLALARMATGSAAMTIAADMAMNGQLTGRGPSDPAERAALQRTGWQPYSVRVGDKWVAYNRLDPLGQTLGFAADFSEAMGRGDIDPEDMDEWQEVMAGGIGAASQFAVNKTYLQGLADLLNMTTDPNRYGEGYVNDFIASFVPFTSAMGAAERFVDPTGREVETPMDAMLAKIPGLSEKLTPKRDLWGAEIKPQQVFGRAYDVLSPARVSQDIESPIDRELLRLKNYPTRIQKKTTFQGVDVNLSKWPEVYDAYVRLAGNEVKDIAFGMGAKEYLDAIVSGNHELSEVYRMLSDGPDGTKAAFIRNAILDYRQLAQIQIMNDPQFAEFAQFVREQQEAKFKASLPQ